MSAVAEYEHLAIAESSATAEYKFIQLSLIHFSYRWQILAIAEYIQRWLKFVSDS